jgi:hypothetical protein
VALHIGTDWMDGQFRLSLAVVIAALAGMSGTYKLAFRARAISLCTALRRPSNAQAAARFLLSHEIELQKMCASMRRKC